MQRLCMHLIYFCLVFSFSILWCCWCLFPSVQFFFWFLVESMTKSQKQHLNTGSHRTKTKRMQWQLSAPPLSHMTSCTYIYFTAITFYSYYRCSTFIFISHLFSLSFDSFCSYSLVFFSLLIRAFGWIHSFNLHRCMDAHSAKFVVLIVERFFLSGNRILFLACVNSALWLWSSPFLFHSCAVVGVFPCFFRFASQTNPLLATKEMIICWKKKFCHTILLTYL